MYIWNSSTFSKIVLHWFYWVENVPIKFISSNNYLRELEELKEFTRCFHFRIFFFFLIKSTSKSFGLWTSRNSENHLGKNETFILSYCGENFELKLIGSKFVFEGFSILKIFKTYLDKNYYVDSVSHIHIFRILHSV